MEMVLAKSDMGHRRALCRAGRGPARWRDAIFAAHPRRLAADAATACSTITGQSRLLEKHPALDASIRLRLPYIEPLNLLQIELMKRHRAGERTIRGSREGIQLSINAIATALAEFGLYPRRALTSYPNPRCALPPEA